MQELEVVAKQTAGKIDCNLDEIKDAVALQMTAYKELEVTESNIAERKSDLATLRKIYKAVDDKRKSIKKEFLQPYEEFEAQVKDVLSVINEPIGLIDGKLKEFDAKRVEEKQAHLHELYKANIEDLADFIPYEKVAKPQWNNKSYDDKDIIYDISEMKTKARVAIETVKALQSEIEGELLEIIKNNDFDITKAIQRHTQYVQDKAKIEAQIKEERKPSAEAMGELNNVVQAFKTVHFIISKEDEEEVENLLNLSDIKFQKVEG